jgi:hypothetical protein
MGARVGPPDTAVDDGASPLAAPEIGQGSLRIPALADEPADPGEVAPMNPTSSLADDGSTALDGQVRLGPTCNLVRPDESQCADRPYSATIVVKTADGQQEVARVASDDDGVFSVALDAGTYQVVPLPPQGWVRPFSTPQMVSIEPGAHTRIVIHYDSGIR